MCKFQVRYGANAQYPNHWKGCESFKEALAIFKLKTSELIKYVCIMQDDTIIVDRLTLSDNSFQESVLIERDINGMEYRIKQFVNGKEEVEFTERRKYA